VSYFLWKAVLWFMSRVTERQRFEAESQPLERGHHEFEEIEI
jgi:hypothetical protein